MTTIVATYFAPKSYAPSLRALHWLMAAIIFFAIGLGIVATFMTPHTASRMALLAVHKSLGLIALALAVVRVGLRLIEGAPPYQQALSWIVQQAAALGHLALYALMFALPISGYVHSSAGQSRFNWFGLFPVPMLVQRDPELDSVAGQAHYLLAWAIGAMLAVHLGAVVWHTWIKKDGVLQRMWPRR